MDYQVKGDMNLFTTAIFHHQCAFRVSISNTLSKKDEAGMKLEGVLTTFVSLPPLVGSLQSQRQGAVCI